MAESSPNAATSTFEKVADKLLEGKRLQLCLQGRYVTLLRQGGKVSCIDSVCFHAGGPLGIGDIEDVNGNACLVCPWHFYKIDIATGEKYYQSTSFENGKMIPGEWKSNGPKQRVHPVEERSDGIYVKLDVGGAVASDRVACSTACGERMIVPNGQDGQCVGADGKRSGDALADKPVLHVKC